MLKDHLNKLEYFCIIVEAKSFLKASEKAYVSQPQLSKVVKQLEEDLNEKLLVRSHSGVEITPAGVKLYELGKSVILNANETQLLIKSENLVSGTVRIGTYDSISRYFFPDFLKFLQKSLPDLTITLSTGRSSVMLKNLKKGDLDIAIVVGPLRESNQIDSKYIYSDMFGFYASPLISQSFKQHLIIFPESVTEEKKVLLKRNKFKHFLNCDNLETVKSLTEQGIGVGLLPHKVARDGALSGKLKLLDKNAKDISPHDILLLNKKGSLNSATKLVMSELERFLAYWSSN